MNDSSYRHLTYTVFISLLLILADLIMGNKAMATNTNNTIKLATFTPPPTPTRLPTLPITPFTPLLPPVTPSPIIAAPLPTGGPVDLNGPDYCIDDEDPEGCDDATAFHVPKGVGGSSGPCNTTVIAQAHKLVASLPQGLKDFRDSLNPAVTNCGYSSGFYSGGYISTYFVIDAFNLAGYRELGKTNPTHVSGTNLLNWWQSQPSGYTFIPYSPAVMQQYANGQVNLTGCVMFLNLNSGVHVGIVNVLQLVNSTAGDGVISILQSGARYFLDRFEVVGWNITNTPLHQTQLSSIAGFGCHQ